MTNFIFDRLLWIFFILFFLVLFSGIFLPLYSDEIAIKFTTARFFLDGGEQLSLFPQCINMVGAMISWVFYPAAIVLSLVFENIGPFGIRVSGVFLALSWFGLIGYWCYRQASKDWYVRLSFLFAYSALGVLPYLWVMSRTEQFIIFPILALSVLAFYAPVKHSKLTVITVSILVVILASIFFYSHPKSVFFAPFIVLLVWKITQPIAIPLRFILLLYILLLVIYVLIGAGGLLDGCQGAPKLKLLLGGFTLSPRLLLVNPLLFLEQAYNNIAFFPERMVRHLIFSGDFQSGWLPPFDIGSWVLRWLNTLISYVILSLVICAHVLAVSFSIFLLFKGKLKLPIALAGLLAVASLSNIAIYMNQSFYDAFQHVAISILIMSFFLQYKDSEDIVFSHRLSQIFIMPLVSLSVVSLLVLLCLLMPSLLRNSGYAKAAIPEQPISVPVFSVIEHLDSIRELGASCNIPEKGYSNLVVDHMTYFAYKDNRRPMHILYTATSYFGADLMGGKLVPFLKSNNSPGVIARCEWFPEEFNGNVLRNSRGYCCVDLEKMY